MIQHKIMVERYVRNAGYVKININSRLYAVSPHQCSLKPLKRTAKIKMISIKSFFSRFNSFIGRLPSSKIDLFYFKIEFVLLRLTEVEKKKFKSKCEEEKT